MPTIETGDYRKLTAYKEADEATRRQMERWKADQKIDDAHMYLLLSRQTLRDLPPEKKKEGNRMGEGMVVFAILFFLFMLQSGQRTPMLIASVVVIFSTFFYLTGFFNPISAQLKKLRKALKSYPEVQPFAQWNEAHPAPAGKKGAHPPKKKKS